MKTNLTENLPVGSRTTTKHGDGGREETENSLGKKQKSILVIDTPKSCTDCPYCGFEQFTHNPACVICEGRFGKDEDIENERSAICPLKDLPQKKVGDDLYEQYGRWTSRIEREVSYRLGFNDCLEEILGENE